MTIEEKQGSNSISGTSHSESAEPKTAKQKFLDNLKTALNNSKAYKETVSFLEWDDQRIGQHFEDLKKPIQKWDIAIAYLESRDKKKSIASADINNPKKIEEMIERIDTQLKTNSPDNLKEIFTGEREKLANARTSLINTWALERAARTVDASSEHLNDAKAFSHAFVNKGTFLGLSSLGNRGKAAFYETIDQISSKLTGKPDIILGEMQYDWVLPKEMRLAYFNAYDHTVAAHSQNLDMAGMFSGMAASIYLHTPPAAAAVNGASKIGGIATFANKAKDVALIGPATLIPAGTNIAAKIPLACVAQAVSLGAISGISNDGDADATRIGVVNGCLIGVGFSSVTSLGKMLPVLGSSIVLNSDSAMLPPPATPSQTKKGAEMAETTQFSPQPTSKNGR